MKLLVVYRHEGRGSSCSVEIFTKESFIEYFVDYTEIEDGEDEDDVLDRREHQAIELFDGSADELMGYMDHESDYNISAGVIHVSRDDKWLILFDPNSSACYSNRIDVIPREADCDQYVKDHYFESPDRTKKEGNEELLRTILGQPLDWDGQTSYQCMFKKEFTSDFWGWADGSRDDEPFLGEGDTLTHGITRLDLDSLGIFE